MPRAFNGQVGLLTPVWALSTESYYAAMALMNQEGKLQSCNSTTQSCKVATKNALMA